MTAPEPQGSLAKPIKLYVVHPGAGDLQNERPGPVHRPGDARSVGSGRGRRSKGDIARGFHAARQRRIADAVVFHSSTPGTSAVPSVRHNLPPQPTRLLGRLEEVEAVRSSLVNADVRLLTLTGPGGVGKTRLALAAAEEVLAAFPDGVWFVDLAAVSDPELVAPTIARTIGARGVREQGRHDGLVAFLRSRTVLLVLDNVEHLLAASLVIDSLLAACPKLKVLATSREPLHLRREHLFQLLPLAVPDCERATWTVEDLAAVPSAALFVERARAANAAFALTDANKAAVVELCQRLDGLPLALEMAAARTRLLGLSALLDQMEHLLSLLRWDAPDLPVRQRTLQATIDWSYRLLATAEQGLFRRLGAFAGGFTVEAATDVAGGPDGDGQADRRSDGRLTNDAAPPVFEVLADLMDKHLVRIDGDGLDGPRFRLPETVREYALARLATSDDAATTRDRHLAYYLALAERAGPELTGADQEVWFDRLEAEHDNLRTALAWANSAGDAGSELRLVAALWPFWVAHGHLRTGLTHAEEALAHIDAGEPALRARVLEGAGTVAAWSHRQRWASELIERGLALSREAGEVAQVANLLIAKAIVAYLGGDIDRARALTDEAIALARSEGAPRLIGVGFRNLVLFAIGAAGTPRARERLRAEIDEPLALLREAGDLRSLAVVLAGRAMLLAGVDESAARIALRESLELAQSLNDHLVTAFVSWTAAVHLVKHLPPAQAARMRGIVEAVEAKVRDGGIINVDDFFGDPQSRTSLDHAATAARDALGERVFAEAVSEGRALLPRQTVTEALNALTTPEAGLATAGPRETVAVANESGAPSRREREVLQLVADGRSNKEIAEALFIAPTTAKYHVTSLFNKLGAYSRAHLVAVAAQRGLL